MKAEIKLKGVTLIAGVPATANGNSGSRLMKGEKYKVIGFVKVPATKDKNNKVIFNEWNGVLVERLATGSQVVMGSNTLIGTSIVFVGVGAEGASAKGFKSYSVSQNCFNSVNDFAAAADGNENGTIFQVDDYEDLDANATFKPADVEVDDTNRAEYTATKSKQFYNCSLVSKVVETV